MRDYGNRKTKSYVQAATGKDERKRSPYSHYGRSNNGIGTDTPKDKTKHCSARPASKAAIRQANRAQKKRARQALKKQLESGLEE